MGLLYLVVDRQNRALVGFNGSITSIPPLFQSNVQTVRVAVVDPTGLFNPAYQLVDLAGYGLRASVGDTPTGSSGGPTPLALQDTFVWDSDGKFFEADLALNTVAIDSFIGALASKGAYFELNLTKDGNRETILQTNITLKAVVDELLSVAPTPTDQFLTKAECLALFAKLVNNLGTRITLRSQNGIYGRELGVNNDGSALDDLINL